MKAASNVASLGKDIATAVQGFTANEKDHADKLVKAGEKIEKAAQGFFALCAEARIAGCSFEGLEIANGKLKAIGTYRSAKNTIVQALTAGVTLIDPATGKVRSKGELAKLTAEARKAKDAAAGDGESDESDGEVDGPTTAGKTERSEAEFCSVALQLLTASRALRSTFAKEIAALAALSAGDTDATTVKARKRSKVVAAAEADTGNDSGDVQDSGIPADVQDAVAEAMAA